MHHRIARRTRTRVRRFSSALAALFVAALAALAATTSASAATTTLTSPTTLSGDVTLGAVGITAETILGVTATATATMSLDWSQPAQLGTEFDPNLVRQARSLDPMVSYSRTAGGTMSVDWTLEDLEVSWDSIGPLDLGSPGVSANGACDLVASGGDYVCNLASNTLQVLDTFPIPGPYVHLRLLADVTVTPEALATFREATFGGVPDGTNNLSLPESPIIDPLAIPCTVGVGDSLTYELGQVTASPGVSVQTSLELEVGAIVPNPTFPIPPDLAFRIPFASPTYALGTTAGSIAMSGDGATFDLGEVQ
ncbi:MAG: hypothetical protein L0206_19335, partial [Actinobacteria bacterium]|nr:hypothetical protein [Actinomycetota bacterium]